MSTPRSPRRALGLLVFAAIAAICHPFPAGAAELSPPAAAVEPVAPPAKGEHRLAGLTLVGGGYAVMAGYAYASWYASEEPGAFFVDDEGWFGKDTYAGGVDKVGHCFANYVITRTGYDLLSWAGLSRGAALTTSLALDALFFAAIEVKDGYTENLGFSWGDVAANLCGNLLATALVLNPALDRALDFRLEYYPSQEYLDAVQESGTVNAAEDYTGMTFGLWYHLGELPGVRGRPLLSWLRFVDLGVTYGARYYRPEPADYREPERELALALTFNVAALARALAGGRAPALVAGTDWVFEYFTVPGSTLEVP